MLLTIITNAVVTSTQNILSNVIVELRVLAAFLPKFASGPAEASRAKCRLWHAMSHIQDDPCGSWKQRCREHRSCIQRPPVNPCYVPGFCGLGS